MATETKATIKRLGEQVRELTAECERLEAERREAAKKLERAEKAGSRTLDTWQASVNGLATDLAAKQQELAAARAELDQIEAAADARQQARNAARDEALGAQFGRPDLQIRASHATFGHTRSQYELELLRMGADGQPVVKSGTDRQGRPYSYPETRFGMSITVYSPYREFTGIDPETREYRYQWQDAQVNWGSLGSLDLGRAQELIALYQKAVAMGHYLNAVAQQWAAEDEAEA